MGTFYKDSTPLVEMNVPGTHDTSTWNYTQSTQAEFYEYTGTDIVPAKIYQCQDRSIFSQLNAGMRAFDLRIGFGPDNTTIIFYHSAAILSLTATLEDVLDGFYQFLDENPTEMIFLSIKVDNTTYGEPLALEQKLYSILTSTPATSYFLDVTSTLPTLGETRGKLVLLRRFDLSLLPSAPALGLNVSAGWLDNVANFSIPLGSGKNAYIEDYYELDGVNGTNEVITYKYNATVKHLEAAKNTDLNQLWISFSSAELDTAIPPDTPRILALGNGTGTPGVNQRLLPYYQATKSNRRGIVLMDWFAQVPGLVESVIGM
ncbi:MAG: hypothetical protein TREMPRED_001537 [Tremellales sp. Tagirdzhanova-0007]|nr:MAG: hypothetical protein TREMPRED_001537 [Tremellales sp. Tagirdzhanova-0007]